MREWPWTFLLGYWMESGGACDEQCYTTHGPTARPPRIGQELKARWPNIITEVRLETQDEEDAYVYITTPESVEEDVLLDMVDFDHRAL